VGAVVRLIGRIKPDVVNTHSSDDSWMAGFVRSNAPRSPHRQDKAREHAYRLGFQLQSFPSSDPHDQSGDPEGLIARGIAQERLWQSPRGSIQIGFASPLPGEKRSGKNTDSRKRILL